MSRKYKQTQDIKSIKSPVSIGYYPKWMMKFLASLRFPSNGQSYHRQF